MIYLQLFWTFFKVGLFTIGGGQAMIPLIIKEVVGHGWLDNDLMLDFIAISESTPGPFAVNIATFTGMDLGGVLGALLATIGVVLPSFIIITLIVWLLYKFMKKRIVQEVFLGVRSSVTGLIGAVFVSLFLTIIFNITSVFNTETFSFDWLGLVLFAALCPLGFIKIKGKMVHPILIILISAVLGILTYGFIPGVW